MSSCSPCSCDNFVLRRCRRCRWLQPFIVIVCSKKAECVRVSFRKINDNTLRLIQHHWNGSSYCWWFSAPTSGAAMPGFWLRSCSPASGTEKRCQTRLRQHHLNGSSYCWRFSAPTSGAAMLRLLVELLFTNPWHRKNVSNQELKSTFVCLPIWSRIRHLWTSMFFRKLLIAVLVPVIWWGGATKRCPALPNRSNRSLVRPRAILWLRLRFWLADNFVEVEVGLEIDTIIVKWLGSETMVRRFGPGFVQMFHFFVRHL